MVTNERAYFIANDWISAWNTRDVDRILKYYDDKQKEISTFSVF